MNNYFLKLILFTVITWCMCVDSRATHVVGSEMYYEYLDSNHVAIDFILYRECASSSVASPVFNYYFFAQSGSDTFTFFFSDSVNLIDSAVFSKAVPSCGLSCNSSTNALIYKKYHFRDTLDITGHSGCEWRVSWTDCCYGGTFSHLGSTNPTIYNYCEFNRCKPSRAPNFLNVPVFNVAYYDDAVLTYPVADTVDVDDSVSIAFAPHLYDSASAATYTGQTAYDAPMAFFGMPNRNLSPPAGFRFDPINREVRFRPIHNNHLMPFTMELTEWRKDSGVYEPIGRLRRTHLITVSDLNYSTPYAPEFMLNSDSLFICRSDTTRLTIFSRDPDDGDTTLISCLHDLDFLAYETTNGTDTNASITMTFTPDLNDSTGYYGTIELMVSDYSCPVSRYERRLLHLFVQDSVTSPLVDAGPDISDSTNSGSFSLHGTIDHLGARNFKWTTGGNGSFSDPYDLNPNYIYGSQDSNACFVELYLTVLDSNGCINQGILRDTLIIQKTFSRYFYNNNHDYYYGNRYSWPANFGAGRYVSFVDYQTDGDGYFDVDSTITEYYYPGPNDQANCLTTLTMSRYGCDTLSEKIYLKRKYTPLNAGSDVSQINERAYLRANRIFSYSPILRWRTLGDGTFSDSLDYYTHYIPGPNDWQQCYVQVVYEELPPNQCFHNIDTVRIEMDLFSFSAGPDQQVGRGDTIFLDAVSSMLLDTAGYWLSTGSGNFQDSTRRQAVYIPSTADLASCSIRFYWYTPFQNCYSQVDEMEVTFKGLSGFDAGSSRMISIHDTIWLDASSPLNTVPKGIWKSAGGGQFGDTLDPKTFYIPSHTDNKRCDFTLYWYSPSFQCDTERDSVRYNFNNSPASIQVATTYFAHDSVQLNGTQAYSGRASGWWSTNGDGYFIDSSEINTLYVPHPNDFARCAHQLYWNTDTSLYPCTNPRSGVFVNFIPTIQTSNTALDTTGDQFRISFSADLPDLMEWMDPKDSSWNNVLPGDDVIYTTDSTQKAQGIIAIPVRQQTNCRTVFDTVTLLINYTPPTGILSMISRPLRAYPNPATKELNIESDKAIEIAKIYDATGKEVLSVNSPKINIEELAPGTYLLRVKFSDGTTGSVRWQKR